MPTADTMIVRTADIITTMEGPVVRPTVFHLLNNSADTRRCLGSMEEEREAARQEEEKRLAEKQAAAVERKALITTARKRPVANENSSPKRTTERSSLTPDVKNIDPFDSRMTIPLRKRLLTANAR